MTNTLADLSLTEAAARLADRSVTAVALTEAALARAAATEPVHHAYVYLDAEHALAQAREADVRWAAGAQRSPIDGIPIGLKDLFLTADMPTHGGAHDEAHYDGPAVDDEPAALLRATGAVLIGKHTTHHFGSGRCPSAARNAVDPVMFSGGSSSGSGVSVALGSSFASLGTDSGGSVRAPAALNGIVGYLPTLGLIPDTGERLLAAASYNGAGVLARSVHDAALVVSAMTGATNLVPSAIATSVAGVRFGLVSQLHTGAVPEVAAAIDRALKVLVDAGAEIVKTDVPELELENVEEIFGLVAGFESPRGHERMIALHPEAYCAALRPGAERGPLISAEQYRDGIARRDALRALIAARMNEHDVAALIGPTLGKQAVPADGMDAMKELHYYAMFTMFVNLVAMPAITVPAGAVAGGLPVGLQIVGRADDDARALDAAARVEATLAL